MSRSLVLPAACLALALAGCPDDVPFNPPASADTGALPGPDAGCPHPCGSECCGVGFACDENAQTCVRLCESDCSDKECGDDGCGGSCGNCRAGSRCGPTFRCAACAPDCAGRECGDDQCNGSCGSCGAGEKCSAAGSCEACAPDCAGKECGDDGCGHACATCPAGMTCNAAFKCVAPPGPDAGCVQACTGKECGPDGCGGTCATCPAGTNCNGDTFKCEAPPPTDAGCVPKCAGKECGQDGCGAVCGACGAGETCNQATAQCEAVTPPDAGCVPSCTGKECGDNGCGGSCGKCASGVCSAGACTCIATGGACGVSSECCSGSCSGAGECCLASGAACASGAGCCSGACQSGSCCAKVGAGCTAAAQCCSGSCQGGFCACKPNCLNKICGEDGCGGSCGSCPSGRTCDDGILCEPTSTGALLFSTSWQTLPNSGSPPVEFRCAGTVTDGGQRCNRNSSTYGLVDLYIDGYDYDLYTACGNPVGSSGLSCLDSTGTFRYSDELAGLKLLCEAMGHDAYQTEGYNDVLATGRWVAVVQTNPFVWGSYSSPVNSSTYIRCDGGATCLPLGSSCSSGTQCCSGTCSGGGCACIPQCNGRQCGSDGCGGVCGTCSAGKACDSWYRCATPLVFSNSWQILPNTDAMIVEFRCAGLVSGGGTRCDRAADGRLVELRFDGASVYDLYPGCDQTDWYCLDNFFPAGELPKWNDPLAGLELMCDAMGYSAGKTTGAVDLLPDPRPTGLVQVNNFLYAWDPGRKRSSSFIQCAP